MIFLLDLSRASFGWTRRRTLLSSPIGRVRVSALRVARPLACLSPQFVGKMRAVHGKSRMELNLVLPMTSPPLAGPIFELTVLVLVFFYLLKSWARTFGRN